MRARDRTAHLGVAPACTACAASTIELSVEARVALMQDQPREGMSI